MSVCMSVMLFHVRWSTIDKQEGTASRLREVNTSAFSGS